MTIQFPGAPDTSLADAKQWLREQLDGGAPCPCCTQFAKVYRRKITSRQVRALIRVWRSAGTDWCHVTTVHPSLAGDGGELSRLRYWGLLEEADERREDGGRAGWWRVTDRGEQYVLGRTTVPKYAHIYDSRCLALSGDLVSVRDALGTKFNYAELMAS